MHRQDIRNLASLCVDFGVKYAVIAPGSRNAPLIVAFTSQEGMECLSITDERSAAFFALGLSQLKGEAVAIICTSGSAVLNFAPAIVEAYYQQLPLIVITADRPQEWIDQSDGQTIRQANIYQNYIKGSFQLPSDQKNENTNYSDRIVAQALDAALSFPMGPVHLNVPLNEPLYTDIPSQKSYQKALKTASVKVELTKLDDYLSVWNASSLKMIVVGQIRPNKELNFLLNHLAQREDIIVIADNLSNISGEKIISSPDLFLASLSESDANAFVPQLLLTIGQSVISKRLKDLLRRNEVKYHWQLYAGIPYADTYRQLSEIMNVDVISFLSKFVTCPVSPNSTFQGLFEKISRARMRFQNYLSTIPFSDMLAVNTILHKIPSDYNVQIANSTPVRLSQLLESREDLSYFCNRGTSGIEGSVSTAAGSAYRSKQNTLFLTGDLSFLYDSNGLWNNYLNAKLKIVVLNNQGANIFSIIGDNEKIEPCKAFFNVPHAVKLDMLCAAYGVNYLKATDQHELEEGLTRLFHETEKTMVLEVQTDSTTNTATFRNLYKKIKD